MRVVVEVGRDELLVGVAENPFQRAIGCGADEVVDLFRRRRALGDEFQVHQRDVRRRHAHRHAIELAIEIRQDEADSLGGACRGRDHRERSRAATIEILVHRIQRRLVAGVGVDGRHHALLDADRVVKDADHRHEAVGGARGVRDDHVLLGELLMVHAVDDSEVGVFARGGDQHALGACGQVGGGLVLGREDAGALECDVDVELLVRQLSRVLDRGDLEGLVADRDGVALDLHVHVQRAVDAIVFQQVNVVFHRSEVVDGDDLDVRALVFQDGTKNQPTDPAKAVDRNTNSHRETSNIQCGRGCRKRA